MSLLTQGLEAVPAGTRILVVAYSGGRDSTALLHALASRAELRPFLRAVHVCHHIEAACEVWAAHCERFCAEIGVTFERLDVTVDVRGSGMEAAARTARYQALAGILDEQDVLVTAHHAEDQAETFLLQALRGAGVAGLAAMPGLAPLGRGRIWRPWLGVERRRITDYAVAHGLVWIEDGSNADTQYARPWLRTHLWPKLTQRWPSAARTLARSAQWAGQASEAIRALAAVDLESAEDRRGTLSIATLSTWSDNRASEVIRLWLRQSGHDPASHRHVGEILKMLTAREHAGPRVVFAGTEVRRFDGRLFAMDRLPAPPVHGLSVTWAAPESVDLPCGCGQLKVSLPAPSIWPEALYIRFRIRGARLLRESGRTEPMADWLRKLRVPPWIRERMPCLYVGDELIALPGYWHHPKMSQWFGGAEPNFSWQHEWGD